MDARIAPQTLTTTRPLPLITTTVRTSLPLMAASTRAITPTHSGPFSAPNRPDTPGSIGHGSLNHNNGATFGTHLTKSPRGLSPRHSPQPQPPPQLGQAPDETLKRDQDKSRQSTPNPGVAAMHSVLGTNPHANARPQDGMPDPSQMSSVVEKAAKQLLIPDQVGSENIQASPVSLSSFGSHDLTTAATATASEATAGPMQAQEAPPTAMMHHRHIEPNPAEAQANRAFTFPGPQPLDHDPRRQMSLPGYQNSPKSPGKRHKCPHCSTDFTRHHNLKSHLLTHSHEKPYECTTCEARFRRLHDLKRHTKLHTGERPHICPQCGRKFARGDALARHNKGQGGCAGARRSSFGIDDDLVHKGDDGMDGVMYGDRDGEADEDEDGSGRRVSEPARKRQNTGNSTQGSYHQHSSTYPPIAVSRSQQGHPNLHPMYPAGPNGPSREPTTNISPKLAQSSLSSLHFGNNNQANVFSQGGMTESPKPISPGHAEQHRLGHHDPSFPPPPRSPNMTQQVHQQNLNRRNTGRGSSPMSLAPPPNSGGPHLPPLHGLNPMMAKQGSQGGKGNGPSMLHQQVPGPGTESQPGSMSSHGQGSGSSIREGMDRDMWQYVKEMESRMARMEELNQKKMQSLEAEVTTLRAQLAQQHAQAAVQQQQQQEAQFEQNK